MLPITSCWIGLSFSLRWQQWRLHWRCPPTHLGRLQVKKFLDFSWNTFCCWIWLCLKCITANSFESGVWNIFRGLHWKFTWTISTWTRLDNSLWHHLAAEVTVAIGNRFCRGFTVHFYNAGQPPQIWQNFIKKRQNISVLFFALEQWFYTGCF